MPSDARTPGGKVRHITKQDRLLLKHIVSLIHKALRIYSCLSVATCIGRTSLLQALKMKKLFNKSVGKQQDSYGGNEPKNPKRAGSMPLQRWLPTRIDSLPIEASLTKEAAWSCSLPSTQRGPLCRKKEAS